MITKRRLGLYALLGSIAAAAVALLASGFFLNVKDDVVMSWEFPLQDNDIPSGRQFHQSNGDVYCGGGYVYAIQSRMFSNSNDLEFWCRVGDPGLDFRLLPEAVKGVTRTSLANLNGRLYSFQAKRFFDFDRSTWISADFGDASYPFVIQPKAKGQYIFSPERSDCPGISVYFDNTYRGTVRTTSYSAVGVWDGVIYLNTGATTLAAPVPATPPSGCEYIPTAVFDDSSKYAYAIFQNRDSSLLIGGAQGGYGKESHSCVPPLEKFNGGTKSDLSKNLNTGDCTPGQVKEYYSYAPFNDETYIGNFPIGTLIALKNDTLSMTKFGAPSPDDWKDPKGTYYRESQAVLNAYGATFIGMYPWGEVISIDRKTGQRKDYRLFQQPTRDNSPTPYFWPAHNRALQRNDVNFDPAAELVYSVTRNGQSLREEGREPTLWGQRVPSIVVLSGMLCASTGNLSGAGHAPSVHVDISTQQAEEYGQVYCSTLANHVMTSTPQGKLATLTVTNRHLTITIDGEVTAIAKHNLTRAALDAIAAMQNAK